jgi:hypothetical protein
MGDWICTSCGADVPKSDISLCVLVLMHMRGGRWCGPVAESKVPSGKPRTAWDVVLEGGPKERGEISPPSRNPSKPKKKSPECEVCGTRERVEYGPDPYSAEINEDYTKRHLCGDCRRARAEEI